MNISRNILIIEDNIDDYELCQRALKKQAYVDYKLRHASSGDDGLELLEEYTPDCILLDYSLPGNNGMSVLRQINKTCPFLPVVILTGQGNDSLAAQLIKAGAQDYIVKSTIDTASIGKVISEAIVNGERLKQNLQETMDSPLIMIVDDNPDDREYCLRILKKVPYPKYVYKEVSGGDAMSDSFNKDGFPDCILLDYSLPGKNGIEILKEVMAHHPFLSVIMMTGQGNESIAVQSIKEGAQDYLIKSELTSEALGRSITTAIKRTSLERELAEKEIVLRKSKDALREATERYDAAVRGSSVGLWDWNVITNELYWSPRFKEILGINEADFVAHFEAFESRLHPDDHKRVIDALIEGHIRHHQPYDIEYRFKHNGGYYIWMHARGQAVWDDQGNPLRMAGSVDNVSIKKSMEQDKERLIQRLTETNEDLEKFAYVASHDLKSPLRAIDSISKWLVEDVGDQLDDKNKDRLATLRGRVLRMEHLLDDLLAYSRAGRNLENTSMVTIGHLVKEVKKLLDVPKGMIIQNSDVMHDVLIPRMPLEQIFHNLIGNAIKHHDKKEGLITISSNDNGEFYTFSVKDDGPGIPIRFQEKIFEMFQMLKSRDEVEGSGMGLALVKKIVNRYGGVIKVNSIEGNGADFTFTWPKNIDFQQVGIKH